MKRKVHPFVEEIEQARKEGHNIPEGIGDKLEEQYHNSDIKNLLTEERESYLKPLHNALPGAMVMGIDVFVRELMVLAWYLGYRQAEDDQLTPTQIVDKLIAGLNNKRKEVE